MLSAVLLSVRRCVVWFLIVVVWMKCNQSSCWFNLNSVIDAVIINTSCSHSSEIFCRSCYEVLFYFVIDTSNNRLNNSPYVAEFVLENCFLRIAFTYFCFLDMTNINVKEAFKVPPMIIPVILTHLFRSKLTHPLAVWI